MKAYEQKDKVKELLEALREQRKKLPQFGFFGSNNWEELDEVIHYLEKVLKNIVVDLDELRASDYDLVYELAEWIEGGDNKSDIYNDYCGS